jgi:hypothetical protein
MSGTTVMMRSSGGLLVETPDSKPVVLGSNLTISPAYSGLPVPGWAAVFDGTSLLALLQGAAEEIKHQKGF